MIRLLISWLPIEKNNKFFETLVMLTDPILTPVRWMIKQSIFGKRGYVLDFTPLITLMILNGLQNYIHSSLMKFL